MDGPNVNKKFYEDFSRKFGDENYHRLIDIGNCSLHIVDGAFSAGTERSEWELKKFLKGALLCLQFSSSPRRLWKCYWLFLVSFRFLRNTVSMFASWLTNDTTKNDWKQNSDDSNWTGEW